MSAAVQKFIEEVIVHFPRREASEADEIMWVRSMNRNLEGFSKEVLERAAQTIIGTCDRRDFQWLPKQCKAACYEADKALKAEKPRLIGSQPASKGASNDDRERLAYELILGPMGKRANRENWIGMLFTFTRDNMRLPQSDAEINHLIRESRLADKDYEKLLRNEYDIHPENALQWTKMRGALIRGWEGRFAKRQALGEYVRTGVLP